MDGCVFLSGLRPVVLTSTVAKEDVRRERKKMLWLPGESLARVPYTSVVVTFSPACAHDCPHLRGKTCCICLRETAVSHLNSDVSDGDSYELAPR
jgi:hypothetical protein